MLSLSLSLPIFSYLLLSLYTHLSTYFWTQINSPSQSNPHHLGHKHRSTAPIMQDPIKHRSTSTDLPSSYPQASIRSNQIRSDRDLPNSDQVRPIPTSSDRSSWAPIKHWSVSLLFVRLGLFVCGCVCISLCFFFFWSKCISVLICMCECVCVHLRKKKKMRSYWVCWARRRKRKKWVNGN